MSTDATELDALPARARLVHAHLVEAGVSSAIRVLPAGAHTAAAAAEALDCEVGAIANSLVFMADDAPVLVMTSGAHRVDTDMVRENLGAASVVMAKPAQVRQATGQVIGGVAPVGHPSPLPTLVDEDLAGYPRLWAAGGTPDTLMPLTFRQLVDLTGGTVVRVARD